MEFFLVKDHRILIDKNRRTLGWDLIVRDTGSIWIPVEITPSTSTSGKESADVTERDIFNRVFCKKLKALLMAEEQEPNEGPSRSKLPRMMMTSGAPISWKLKSTLCLKRRSAGEWKREWVQVTGKGGPRNFLDRFKSVMDRYGLTVKVKVEICEMELVTTSYAKIEKLVTDEVDIGQLSSLGDVGPDKVLNEETAGAQVYCSGVWNRNFWGREGGHHIQSCGITIKCVVYGRQCGEAMLTNGRDSILGRVLKEEICSDVVIGTENGGEVKCHRAILSANSPVLEAMFRGGFREGRTGRVDMEEVSKEGVEALMEWMYFGSLEGVMKDSGIALEVLMQAHKYEMEGLEGVVIEMMEGRGDEWLGVEGALHLFVFATKLPGQTGETLKIRVLDLVKRNFKEFKESPSFDALFEENPIVAKELFKCLVDIELRKQKEEKEMEKEKKKN